ncbi:hypothetical protein [Escherichia coli]|nr:hypothetical protein [Escherichia coli]MDY7948461.1 hypothetical protein [Escherichia coli]
MPLVNQETPGEQMGQGVITEVTSESLIVPRMLGFDIQTGFVE